MALKSPLGVSMPSVVQLEEMQQANKMFSRVRRLCWTKCVRGFSEPDLDVGELECIDRCVLKFLEVQNLIGARMNTTHSLLAAQAAELTKMDK